MVTLFIFYLHTIAAVALFTKRWQEGDLKEASLAVLFMLLIFSVGWSMSAFIMNFLIEEKGFGLWLDRNALALVLLTFLEAIFYYLQTQRKKRKVLRPA
ncbi:MAG: hypothetical protein HY033_11695 [Ignavibacteriae bacterium]|nr:hypothetical protein [Ignavibacteria bacterium]MBI3365561.1 hypothetical protein [Ignavibacteriota bacterium]